MPLHKLCASSRLLFLIACKLARYSWEGFLRLLLTETWIKIIQQLLILNFPLWLGTNNSDSLYWFVRHWGCSEESKYPWWYRSFSKQCRNCIIGSFWRNQDGRFWQVCVQMFWAKWALLFKSVWKFWCFLADWRKQNYLLCIDFFFPQFSAYGNYK